MKGDKLKLAIASSLAGIEPTKKEQGEALAEAVDMLLGVATDIGRIADALEKLSECADGVHPSAFRVIKQD